MALKTRSGEGETPADPAAGRFADALTAAGFSNVAIRAFPSDGVTVFGDKRMPYAWSCDHGSLAAVRPDGTLHPLVDSTRHPGCVVRGSTSLPADGVTAPLLTEAQFLAGEDAVGAFVLTEPGTTAFAPILTAVLDRGGFGIVTDHAADPFAHPDDVPAIAGMTENGTAFADCETRPFTSFAVPPRHGMRLRTLVQSGLLRVKATCVARRFAGTLPVVTGVIPGRRPHEVWFLTTFGAAGAIGTVRRYCFTGKPACTLRIVAAAERSGLTAFLETERMSRDVRGVYGCEAATRGLGTGARALPDPVSFDAAGGVARPFAARPAAVPPPSGARWRTYAAGIVASRATEALPQDFVRVPRHDRPSLAVPVAEGALAHVFGELDGRRSLAEVLAAVEHRLQARLDESGVRRTVQFVTRLAEYGYFTCTDAGSVGRDDLVTAMRAAGVRAGDVLLVHASLSAFGHVRGGARTMLEAIREAVGPAGTALFPAFACCYRVYANVNKRIDYRPFDPQDVSSVRWIGTVPMAFLRDHPEAPRSRHPANAWTGFGPEAAALLATHRPDDPPFGATSPLAQARARKGKALFLGADLSACTFLHHLEDCCDLPGLGPALVSVKGEDGHPRDVAVPRHVLGPRAFYRMAEDARFFREAKAAGLKIGRARAGIGTVKLLDLAELAEIGTALCRRDPRIILSDDLR